MKKYILSALLLCASLLHVSAQQYPCPYVNAGPDVSLPCGSNTTSLSATYLASGSTATYRLDSIGFAPYPYLRGSAPPAPFYTQDDEYSDSIRLPFTFCFFGVPHKWVVIGNNGMISFNTAMYASQYNPWSLTAAATIPSPNQQLNSIMGPYMDIIPGELPVADSNYVNYATIGTAPCRKFVVSYYQVPFYNTGICPGDNLTSQIVLYETTNVIEIYIASKTSCAGWNGGLAIEGIQNAAGTVAYPVPGRNNTVWTCTNDARRFTPTGPNDVTINWYQDSISNSTHIASTDTVSVSPPNNRSTTYIVSATYNTCDTPHTVVTDTIRVNVLQSAGPTQYLSCPSPTASINMNATGTGTWLALSTNPSATTIANPTSPTTSISGFSVPGSYRFEWSAGLCYDTTTVIVTARPNAGPDLNVCKHDTARMNAYGTGTWSALATNPVPTVIANPTQNNTIITGYTAGGAYGYVWTTSAGCSDTMYVNIPFFTIAVTAASTSVCQFSNTTVTATPSPNTLSPFNYTWLDSGIVSSPHSQTTVVNGLPGNTYFHVQVTSNDGCKLTDSVLITTTTLVGTTIKAGASPTLICPGDPTQLTVVANPNSCGAAVGGCSAANTPVSVGTATTYQNGAASQYPSPYGNFYKSAHHQFLIHASELLSQVPSGGQIKSLAFQIKNANSPSAVSGLTISLTCVNNDSLDGAFIARGSLTQVYYNASYLPANGWNVHTFQTPYDWDGVSNLLVDVCFNANTSSNINPKMYYTTTPFQSVWCTASNAPSGQCTIIGTPINPAVPYAQLFQRPNMQFNMCITNLAGANLQWTPSTGPNAPTPANLDTVIAHPVSSTQYQVALTSPNGCVNYDFVTVNIDTSVKLSFNRDTFICTPQPIALHAAVTGINPDSVTYQWTASSGPTPTGGLGAQYSTYTVTPSASVTYIVKITPHGGGCIQMDTMHVTLGGALPVNKIVDSITCAGTSTGKIIINMTAGTAPYRYTWSPVATNVDSIYNLGAGTYYLTVTDTAGCVGHDTTRLVPPSPLALRFDSTNILCYNVNTGTVLAHPSGGRSPYRYTWSPSATNSASLSNLAAGTYHLTVTDTSGCTISGTVNITQPTQVTSSASTTSLSGAGTHDGTITLTTSGGTPGYTYSSIPAVSGLPNATGLDTGIYIITVCDANHCCVNDTAHITGPPPIRINFVTTNNLCYGYCNGIASASASGGVSPYTYRWNNPTNSTTDTITGLCAGRYTVTVTDHNGITVSKDTTITAPPQIAQHIDSTQITCFGAANGALKDSAYLGAGSYVYIWTPGPGGNVNPITNLGPGTYIVQVYDANQCTVSDTVTLTQPSQVTAAIITTDSVTCFGYNNGYANVKGSGGRPPYHYTWSGSNSVDSFATNLVAGGPQSVTVTDASGCSASATFTIYQPAAVASSATPTSLTGAGTHDGKITLTTSGGTPAYTYTSTPSVTGLPNATGLDTGIYYITVCDAHGCCVHDTAHVTGPPPIHITFVTTNDRCHTDSNGTATATVSGGVPPYTYVWNTVPATAPLGTGLSIGNLAPGTYEIAVTDSNHITVSKDTTITAPPALGMRIDSTPITCYNASNGTLRDSVYGGTPGYTIIWTPGGSGNPITGLGPNTYIVNVTDSNGCTAADTAYLGQPTPVTAAIISTDSVICFGQSNGYANVLAGGGHAPYHYAWSGSTSVDSFANNLAAGLQTVSVTDASGCQATASFTIYQPTQVAITAIDTTSSHCASSHDGIAIAVVSGGSSGYTYTWDATAGRDTITGLTPGPHTLNVTDTKGCSQTSAFVINTQYVLAITMGTDSVTCNGYTNGVAFTNVLNGSPAYTYHWSPSTSTTDSATGLAAGPQAVTVTDLYGCTASGSTIVGQPIPITDASFASNPLCAHDQNGKVWITAGGTTAPYTFTFNGGAAVHLITDTITGLGAGTYSFTVQDGHGCTKTDNVTLTDPPALLIPQPAIQGISCANDANGVITVSPTGGTPPYSYNWNPGGYTSSSQSSLGANTYSITVTDANGCVQSTSVTLTSPPRISLLDMHVDSTSCPGSTDGHIVVDPTGGTPGNTQPYTYSLDGVTWYTNHNFYDLAAGAYTVYVMDSPGCIFDTLINVYQPYPVTASINPQDSLIALGTSIQLFTVINNITTQQINSYTWSPVEGLSCIDCPNPVSSPFQTTNYTLTVNYGKNCTTTASNTIEVGKGADVYIPNAFTPNGDGVNDAFGVFGTSLQSVGMKIFDRWGEKVFDSGDSQWASWDGTYRGVLEPPGVYTYFVTLVYLNGEQTTREGSITLIR